MKNKKQSSTPPEEQPSQPKVHCIYDVMVPTAELQPHPKNPNSHPADQVRLLAKIITNQGWRSPIIVSNRSGKIVAGHGRLEAAKLIGAERCPVNFQEFESDEEEIAHLIADNRIAELAELDEAQIAGLLSELTEAGFDQELTGFDLQAAIASEGQKIDKSPEEREVVYNETQIRQLVLIYSIPQFEHTVKMLNDIAAHLGTETHADTVDHCIKQAYDRIGHPEAAD